MALLKLLDSMTDKPSFFLIKKKTSWCKCLLSGFRGESFLFNFLKIENKFSKQGYHINDIQKYGETSALLTCELIMVKPKKKPSKYAPLSPIIKIFKILSDKSTNKTETIT